MGLRGKLHKFFLCRLLYYLLRDVGNEQRVSKYMF